MTTQNSIRKVLIPAAGFGARVGTPPAKELFPDPKTRKPLIEFSLDIAKSLDAQARVITRKDKTVLIEALKKYKNAEVFLIEASKEWPDTLLQSEPCWSDFNVVILPDTRFLPINAVSDIFSELEMGADLAFAVFPVDDYSTWGVLAKNKDTWHICEKPSNLDCLKFEIVNAWGIFGFKKEFGKELLTKMLESGFDHKMRPIQKIVKTIPLEMFKDLTR